MGLQDFGWYRGQFEKRAAAVYKTQGFGFRKRLKAAFAPTPKPLSVDETLTRLERISPGFVQWARDLSATPKR